MNKITKTSLALVALGLLSTSALASSGKQDTSFLKKDKETPMEAPVAQEMMDKYVVLEAAYQFNDYKPKYDNASRATDNFKDSGSLGVGLGKIINKNFLVDAMVSYVPETDFDFTSSGNSDKYDSTVATTKLMLNGTYLIDTPKENVSPYVTVGLGTAYNQFDITTTRGGTATKFDKSKLDFAYQVGAGVSYKLENDYRVSLGYRFADNGNTYKIDGVTSDRLQSHSVVLGLRVPF
ncbi:MAG: acyloxyacyl hydrolase [Rickettsiales bacterium]|jgi:opacity protein-like surface antigen|nr:acyloxyacyl hydrolase [Rickettsiales bacterium]